MLKQRIITALILAPIALIGVFLLPLEGFAIFFAAVVLLGAWEWSALAECKKVASRTAYTLTFLPLLGLFWFLNSTFIPSAVIYIAILLWMFACLWIVRYPSRCLWTPRASRMIIGLLVLVAFWLSLVEIKSLEKGNHWLLQLLLIVWSADIGAYFSGKRFGKRKLAPNVSPGKTWEGVIGGSVVVAFVSIIFALSIELTGSSLVYFVALSVGVGLLSVMGDLFESMLKRHVGIKDSGKILPGHGGILDRIDSLLVAAPFFFVGLTTLVLTN